MVTVLSCRTSVRWIGGARGCLQKTWAEREVVGRRNDAPSSRIGAQDAYGVGVRRNACLWPPTVPVPAICPLSLILVAMVKTQPDSLGISVFRSMRTPFCQMNARTDPGPPLLT